MSEQTATKVTSLPTSRITGERSDLSESLSTRDASRALGVSERTVRRAIERGDLVAVKEGRALQIPVAAIDDFRARQRGSPIPVRPLLHLVDFADDGDVTGPTSATEPAAPVIRLPAPLTGFIGRQREIAAVSDLLSRDDVRLVTLTGVGGVGKTRLAIRAAEAAAGAYADGVVFVPLGSIRDPALVPPAIIQTLGLRDGLVRSPVEQLGAFFQTKRMLLILDNFEHVTAAGPAVVALLSACPSLTMLVTSRVPLRVSGERVYGVHPLRLPKPPGAEAADRAAPLTELDQVESIQLFVERAQAARAGFTLTPDQAPAVAAICTRLDGLPLAIELAAARCTVLTPERMLARLDQRLPLLTGGPRDQPDRLRTMRDAITWSYDLLRPEEQRLFHRLSIFAGGFTLEAAEAMVRLPAEGRAPGGAGEALDFACFEALVGQSLVVPLEPAVKDANPVRPAEPRFAMLETIREFGREKLEGSGEVEAVHAVHAAHLLELAETLGASPAETAQAIWLDRMAAERDNARVALAWATSQRDTDLALRLAAALVPVWRGRGPYGEGRDWLERALALGDGPTAARLRALVGLTQLLGLQADYARAATVADEAVRLARAAGDRLRTAQGLMALGHAVDRQGDLERGAACYEEALTLFRDLDHTIGVADALDHLGTLAWERDDVTRFAALAEESLALRRQIEDGPGIIGTLDRLSLAARVGGDLRRQAALASEIVAMAREVDDPYIIASTLWTAASIAGERGQATLSARLFGAEDALRQTTGFVLDQAFSEDYVAVVNDIRASLGEARFASIWAAGRSLTPAQALAEAMAAMDHLAAASTPTTTPVSSAAWHTVYGLTPREREVLRLVVGGASDKEIAATLFVARSTASKHVSAILDKLGAESRTAAAAIAYRDGLL